MSSFDKNISPKKKKSNMKRTLDSSIETMMDSSSTKKLKNS